MSNTRASNPPAGGDASTVHLLIINPNTTEHMTQGLRDNLVPLTPPGVELTFYTAREDLGAPAVITDITTGVASANACARDIAEQKLLDVYDGFLVSCFSDHPLTHILREKTSKPVFNILEASITQSLLLAPRFGIITTGTGFGFIYHQDVQKFLGGPSNRFAGLLTTGLGPADFKTGDEETKKEVERKVGATAVKMREMGADVIIMGCAGMAGMEEVLRKAVKEAGLGNIQVVDGAKAGVQFLAGLARLDKASRS